MDSPVWIDVFYDVIMALISINSGKFSGGAHYHFVTELCWQNFFWQMIHWWNMDSRGSAQLKTWLDQDRTWPGWLVASLRLYHIHNLLPAASCLIYRVARWEPAPAVNLTGKTDDVMCVQCPAFIARWKATTFKFSVIDRLALGHTRQESDENFDKNCCHRNCTLICRYDT